MVTYVRKGYGEQPTGVVVPRPPRTPSPGTYREDESEVGEEFLICLSGFKPGPVRITVTAPGGQEVIKLAFPPRDPDRPSQSLTDIPQLRRDPLPGETLGVYRVTARQGELKVRDQYKVVAAKVPGLRVRDFIVERGEAVRIILSGFEPRQSVPVNVYFREKDTVGPFTFRTRLTFRVGRNGGRVADVPTTKSDPRGCYAFLPGLPGQALNSFICNVRPR